MRKNKLKLQQEGFYKIAKFPAIQDKGNQRKKTTKALRALEAGLSKGRKGAKGVTVQRFTPAVEPLGSRGMQMLRQ